MIPSYKTYHYHYNDLYDFTIHIGTVEIFDIYEIRGFSLYINEHEIYSSGFSSYGLLNLLNGVGFMDSYISDFMLFKNNTLSIDVFDIQLNISRDNGELTEFIEWVRVSSLTDDELRDLKINDIFN